MKRAACVLLLAALMAGCDAGQPETAHLSAAFVDVWQALHPGDPGLTWSMEKSDMARDGSFPGEKSRRIDRILVRTSYWRPHAVRIIGDVPIARRDGKDIFPSDHFGLTAVLTTRPK